ncbi:hypothetical protein ASPNIDRAFT_35715 [Aspergillus niger ATCC 1015]|uniref:Uncharacterized protein n=1 Tax=Aspergillus niger (strain ATCC 1015 / CBS 113.46 / FGSC A1144 / LSHB Ac4 / NCTC 3858a / NRRL 328 / USDA 3528.7) TaxID=380704 RepID=G3XQL3_ASPNA|nr:hypothetical protein ASPNIDRAFT_35715 [Aspergillus niger ATCC 1015]
MPSTPEPASPQSTNSKRLDRDDRIRVLTLRDAGFTYQQIVDQLQISYRQVQYTSKGNTSKLSDEEVDHIIQWISSSKRTRRLPFYRVIEELQLPVGRGYTRCKALRKPPLTSANKQARNSGNRDAT